MIYFVMQDGGGAHEPEGVISVWTSREAAWDDAERLIAEETAALGRPDVKPPYFVREVEADRPGALWESLT